MEIWKDIEGYEGLYQVSNYGRVKSLARMTHFKDGRKPRIYPEMFRSPQVTGGDYLAVRLSKNNVLTSHKVHRLVAKAFIPNPHNKEQVNHMDANKQNNHVDNLEWVTNAENIKHAWDNGLIGRYTRPVGCYTKEGVLVKEYPSAESTSEDGFIPQNVSGVCSERERRYSHRGFIWKYLD